MSDTKKPQWYVIHTFAGYENKVKTNIERLVENRNMQDQIPEVVIPMQKEVEIKNNKPKEVEKMIYPGYVFVKMIHNDETWYVVRNTRGVTSFVGPGSEPVPLTDEEVASMGIETNEIPLEVPDIGYKVGDTVVVKNETFKDAEGVVNEISLSKQSVTVMLSIFGRETPVELKLHEVELLA